MSTGVPDVPATVPTYVAFACVRGVPAGVPGVPGLGAQSGVYGVHGATPGVCSGVHSVPVCEYGTRAGVSGVPVPAGAPCKHVLWSNVNRPSRATSTCLVVAINGPTHINKP